MSDQDDAAAVLADVVELGTTPQEVELGEAVARHVSARPVAVRREPDPDVLATLRPQANLGLATTRELLDELRTRIEVDYLMGGGGLDYTTVGGRPEGAPP